ncbi:hypothetical protein [Vibrio crassostreae]|uniref:hypothetical protein n=1 Tax=Vibrio crassostreae TaxID=246167 RepID=UPI0006383ABE|nr:hypothetical protein [Vibrio crassostreae]TCO06160.1 hypothetical protein EDB30_1017 [Vibrio crassostreae]CAK1841285.1 exported hypothetical protein [Vibrio crassostreae]CAK1842608.1 exported hypothetical protein [Vibrio crassostreae]CAK1909974.1 exported hypothetical protein [Vibrio crassostreae]CAK2048111.1 exported hypothetical protein [Vibrio crassostreae]
MKKLTLYAATVTAILGAQVQAAPGDVQLVGFVSPVCEVTGLSTQLMDFGNVSQIQNLSVSGLNMKCNDVDGATVTLTSAEGGLESDDSEDYALTYDATFNPSGLAPFTLNAPGGPGLNDVSVSNSYGGSGALATGVAASIDIVTTETSPWAGGYSDTLTVNITSN